MKLILVRHGETKENSEGIIQGHLDSELSNVGVMQAKKLAERLKDEKIDVVYSSDLRRAVDTAKEVMRYHPYLKLKKDARIRERFFGEIEDKKIEEEFFRNTNWENPPLGIESDKEMVGRVKEFLDEIISNHKGENVLVVCHGGTKAAFISAIKNPDAEKIEWFWTDNTGVSIISFEEKPKIELLNCTKHLDES